MRDFFMVMPEYFLKYNLSVLYKRDQRLTCMSALQYTKESFMLLCENYGPHDKETKHPPASAFASTLTAIYSARAQMNQMPPAPVSLGILAATVDVNDYGSSSATETLVLNTRLITERYPSKQEYKSGILAVLPWTADILEHESSEYFGNESLVIETPRCSVLVLVCVVSAGPQGYGAGGDGGLGVDLGGTGGHGGSGTGGGSVLPFIFVGKGVLPESAIGGVGGGASGGAAGGVIGGEYSAPSAGAAGGVDVGVAGGFDGGVAGGAADVAIGEEYTAPAVVPEVSPVSPPGSEYAAPH
ncbi:PE-PGRS family protein PE_PGRS33-like [Penaeus monodon]|uniref:PE-PGRS family protein PE_PGRS33-like n=1 Tax=Penaeus monodon TaxID=6687 RepID=UPI0018A7CD79|nr:PE-PGRS family protein PE_PGRS33-like [Penaeus monodon]